ncbi:MAG: imidazole glycerol phosphate synthase subunit HisH [Thermogutta sp.]|nr:imidazole glycerol phosphate synthase subunit HisH [Thermogutta sp.]HPU06878.1 imidazole glycerol phosphate synthase subunit HisH [Thermogutta sp.]HPZ82918.1 imidazole glycerol phosphate synthase subunit HisH [Thermogutta sp.]HQF13276.1 imidazole glycerol phosphate synthase subunit HisH [Thermogutta sp.]
MTNTPHEQSDVTIVDYGMGNLRSVQKAFERLGLRAEITDVPDRILIAERLVVPGVGAFGDAIQELERRGLVKPIMKFIESGRPFLGICLGLQLLFEKSYENGVHKGLGLLRGDVVRFELPSEFSIPHMGWNQVRQECPTPLMRDIPDESYFYFVHSYYVVPTDPEVVAGTTDYGVRFCSMIRQDNVFATQFHPEKSQSLGLQLLRNFASLVS